MTKQEFLAMSLPYGLKIINDGNEIETISALGDSFQFQIRGRSFAYGWYGETFDCKPILRPLSDLTKEIEHKGERFVPIERIFNMSGHYEIGANWFKQHNIKCLPFFIAQYLIELHFDITDLISKGEAIDVNTLDINPYK